jgi:myo-inositol-1(or 4)-monophosphatase
MNLEEICSKVCALVRETGSFIREESKKNVIDKVEVKGLNNFVTYVDKTSEQKLVAGLSKILPNAGFIVEEGSVKETKTQYRWVIDPLDGTTNFIHNLPPYSISVALMDENKVILGVVLEVCTNECFYAWKGSKAYNNESIISVTRVPAVKDALIATGFPYYDFSRMKSFLESLDYFFVHSHGVRRLGSAAADLAYVACGRFEAFYEYSLNSWDVAAGALIVQQAGGKVTDFNGSDNYIFGKEIIASNNSIYPEFFQIVNKFLKSK